MTRSPKKPAPKPPTPRHRPAARKVGSASRRAQPRVIDAVPVTAAELRKLQRELERRMAGPGSRGTKRTVHPGSGEPSRPAPMRWNPDPDDVQKSVAQLVLTIVEFLRQLMERQAIRRMDAQTLSEAEVEAVGQALMRLEETVREIGARFGLTPEDLNLDLGPIKLI